MFLSRSELLGGSGLLSGFAAFNFDSVPRGIRSMTRNCRSRGAGKPLRRERGHHRPECVFFKTLAVFFYPDNPCNFM